MAYRIIYHQQAKAELNAVYADIAMASGDRIAGNYVDGVITFIEGLKTFQSVAPFGKARFSACASLATNAALA